MALQMGLVALGAAAATQTLSKDKKAIEQQAEHIRSLTQSITTGSTTSQMISASINRLKDELGVLRATDWNGSILSASGSMLAKFAGISSTTMAQAFPS